MGKTPGKVKGDALGGTLGNGLGGDVPISGTKVGTLLGLFWLSPPQRPTQRINIRVIL